jgi:aspartyl-tRNA(Asn)/glutamyl-tRNA(Gln) amidotransferase subunit A
MRINHQTIKSLAPNIRSGKISPVTVLEAVLERIDSLEPKVKAFVSVFSQEALEAAKTADREIASGNYKGPLHGIPVAIKDIFDVEGHPTKYGSNFRTDEKAKRDAASVARLRDAGAIIVGKTETHECAFGCTTPTTRNPWNYGHVPGGSSGGSAAAVAAAECFMALGSDTGGSIRSPASHCGIFGLKPTYDLISREGALTLSWSLDHVGPMTRSVWDLAAALNALVAKTSGREVTDYTEEIDFEISGIRIGIPESYFFDRLHPDVAACIEDAVADFADNGAQLSKQPIPYADQILATHFCMMFAEASTYHSQFLKANPDGYGVEVRKLLQAGQFIPATDYITAQRVRSLIGKEWSDLLRRIDVLIAPAVAAPASKIGEEYWTDAIGATESILSAFSRLAVPANLLGLPSICIPCGVVGPNLPVGLQLIGRPYEEALLLRIAHSYERIKGTEGQLPRETEFNNGINLR